MNCIIQSRGKRASLWKCRSYVRVQTKTRKQEVDNFECSPHMNKDLKRVNELIYWESTWWLERNEEKAARNNCSREIYNRQQLLWGTKNILNGGQGEWRYYENFLWFFSLLKLILAIWEIFTIHWINTYIKGGRRVLDMGKGGRRVIAEFSTKGKGSHKFKKTCQENIPNHQNSRQKASTTR